MPQDSTFWSDRRVCVTGGGGFLGRVLCRRLAKLGCRSIFIPRQGQYDLTDAAAVNQMYDDARPDIVINLAAEVGGINANLVQPGRFFFANMAMGIHLIERARQMGIEKFVQVGTVCSYPKHCPVPFHEFDLWNGFPEETNAPYGIAKKALLVMLQAYRQQYGFNGAFVMPVNLYGPEDNFDPQTSHVIPALIRKYCHAKDTGASTVLCWGDGTPSREFLYVDDAADAVLIAAEHLDDSEPVNIGTGKEITICELANRIAEMVGYTGRTEWDTSKPGGQPRRRLCIDRAAEVLGWRASTSLETGLNRTIGWWARRQRITRHSPIAI